jgi:hypothetical protein
MSNKCVAKQQIIWTKGYKWDDEYHSYDIIAYVRQDKTYRLTILIINKDDENAYIDISTGWRLVTDQLHPSVYPIYNHANYRRHFAEIAFDINCAMNPKCQSIRDYTLFARFYKEYKLLPGSMIGYCSEFWLTCNYSYGLKISLKQVFVRDTSLEYYGNLNANPEWMHGVGKMSQLSGTLNWLRDKQKNQSYSEIFKEAFSWSANTITDHFTGHYRDKIAGTILILPTPVINIIVSYIL